jgi:hypothetical protein
MIAALIFIFILATLLTMRRAKPKMTLIFFFISLSCVTLLFLHHASDELGLSF